jgi:subtilase family serine protease
MAKRSLVIPLLLIATFLFASVAFAKKRNVDDNDTVTIHGNVHPNARPEFDLGPTDKKLRCDRIVLVLAPRSNGRQTVDDLLRAQHDPASPLYHQWLTPAEFGQRFGISDDDLADVTAWLQRSGFTIDEVAPGRLWINFSGTVGDVERGLHTSMHDYEVGGKVHHANAIDPQIPRGLADIVKGVLTLNDFGRSPMNLGIKPVPEFTSSTGNHYLAPADFAKIYNVNPLYTAGITGSGQTVAIVGRTDISLADVQYFRSYFGLPANDPVFVHNGTDPGDLGGGEEGEADLDVEWAGAVAKNATVKFVISKSTTTTDGVDLSAQYIVNNNVAKVMSTSFGQCESSMGTTENNFYSNLWSQASAQGITAFVSAGDSGASGCDGGSATTGTGRAVSGLSSTPYNVAVGGTQLNDTANPSAYWSSTTNSTDKSSVLSYVPEIAWNESGTQTGGSGLWSTGGGVSTIYAKPSWQACVGVPADGKRDVPDVALSAASHDGYLVIQGHTSTVSGLGAVGGTSASSPSFAGLMALVVQKTGVGQGNANTTFYRLANAQYASGGAVIFHDVQSGNNSVPGVTGFSCGTGYDAATGVGTVDANALVNNWGGSTPTPDFTISASPNSLTLAPNTSGASTISTTVSGGFNSAISLSASGVPAGASVSFSPTSIAAPGSGSSTMTVSSGSAAAGTYTITVTGTGGSKTHTASVTLTVGSAVASQLLSNPGFESGNNGAWTITSGVIDSSASPAAHTGSWKAWLDGYGSAHTDYAYQQITIPSTATTATLTFWLRVTTAETTTSVAYDTLKVQVLDTAGNVLQTLATYSNLNASASYAQKSFDLSARRGQTIRIRFYGVEDTSLQTSFLVDDTALNVQ